MPIRQDVQALRGIAVLLVVLFHLGLLPSGFLGVDVFFVISGYLMALMYDPARTSDFFAKRSRRLLPAYFATVAATLVASALVTKPTDFVQVVQQSWFAVTLTPNIGFWLENSYFDKSAFKPLLHLWSLGVEIQFYLLVPALSWFLRRVRTPGLLFLGSASFAACLLVVLVSPKSSFFLVPLRLWEFLIGFGIASIPPHARPSAGVGVVGLTLVLATAILPVDGSAQSIVRGHPALGALLACAGTALVIASGLPAMLLRNVLAMGLARLGDWSYSVYLAHFPVIVLAMYRPFGGTVLHPESLSKLAALVLGIGFTSTLLYRCVERPMRRQPLRLAWGVYAPLAVLVLGLGAAAAQTAVLLPQEAAIYAAWTDRDTYRCGKVFRVLHPKAEACEITPAIPTPASRILLVGNSHADSIKATFAQAAAARRATVYFVVDNDPLMKGARLGATQVSTLARNLGADAIVLHYSPDAINVDAIREVSEQVRPLGVPVAFVMPVPVWKQHVPRMLLASMKDHAPVEEQSLSEYERDRSPLRHELATVGVRTYDIAAILCHPACQTTGLNGRPLYFDQSHLTLTGSELLRPIFERLTDDLVRATRIKRESGGTPAAHGRAQPN